MSVTEIVCLLCKGAGVVVTSNGASSSCCTACMGHGRIRAKDAIVSAVRQPEPVGRKDDGGKRRWDLAPFKAFDGVVDVITFGAKKYAPNNWRAVEHDRYLAALLRHMSAFMQGEVIDPDSGLPHMSHIACNACFLSELGAQPPSRDPQAT